MLLNYQYNGVCPYCQFMVHFSPIGGWKDHHKKLSDERTTSVFAVCDNCYRNLLLFFEEMELKDQILGKIYGTYPVISKITKPNGVSDSIWEDYVEGVICLSANAPKGAVTLFRRATQNLVLELGANKDLKLYAQIKELKDKGIISDHLSDIATELRLWGNDRFHRQCKSPCESRVLIIFKNAAPEVFFLWKS